MTQSTENSVHSRRNHTSGRPVDPGPSRERAIEHIHAHAERIKQRELETAFTKLGNQGDLTEMQREIIADMADTLITELVAPPTQSLRNARSEDRSDVQTALELFDPDSLSNGE
ncbi:MULTISPECIES: glutamyl-tRNA reductase [Halococcus]|uniref:glutamyl-tRNA reductase n=1 Tax=Halococcus TaxID=2249 RepID=UPI00067798FF|nr:MULTISPECIES: glutamyl-tRNA reductase [Halococcus]